MLGFTRTRGERDLPFATGSTTAIGRDERSLRRSRIWNLSIVLMLVTAAVVTFLVSNTFTLQILSLALLNGALTVALTTSFGFAGTFNLSQGSFYGIGAYTAAVMLTDHGASFGTALAGSVLISTLGGVVMGSVSVRLRDDYFAFASIAFTVIVTQAFVNMPEITRGGSGFFGIPPVSIFGWTIDSAADSFALSAFGFAIVFLITRQVTSTYFGRAMLAVNHDEMSARSMGISVPFTRITAMAISSGLAGLTGCILTVTTLFIQPGDFSTVFSMNVTLWAIIGGATSLVGAAFAGAAVTILQEQLRVLVDYRLATLGFVVLVAVYIRGKVIPLPRSFMRWGARK